jgi:hypothetical protein
MRSRRTNREPYPKASAIPSILRCPISFGPSIRLFCHTRTHRSRCMPPPTICPTQKRPPLPSIDQKEYFLDSMQRYDVF